MAARNVPLSLGSHLGGASYDPDTQELSVTFAGGSTGIYSGVPEDVVDAFSNAPSSGSYLHAVIKQYPYRKA